MKKLFSVVAVLTLMLTLCYLPAGAAEELLIEGGDFEFLALGNTLEPDGKNKGWGTVELDLGTSKVMEENGNKFIRIGQESNHKFSSFFGLFKDRCLEAGATYRCEFDFRFSDSAKGQEHHYTILGAGGTIQRVDFGKETANVTDKGNGWKHIKIKDFTPTAADAGKVDSIRFLLQNDQLASRYIDIDNVRFVKVEDAPVSSTAASSRSTENSSTAPATGNSSTAKPSVSSVAPVSSEQVVSEAEVISQEDVESEDSNDNSTSSEQVSNEPEEDEGGPWLWIIVLGVLLLAGAGVLVYILVIKKKPEVDTEQK